MILMYVGATRGILLIKEYSARIHEVAAIDEAADLTSVPTLPCGHVRLLPTVASFWYLSKWLKLRLKLEKIYFDWSSCHV